MKNVASLFPAEGRKALEEKLGIFLTDDHDYSDEELQQLYETITDNFHVITEVFDLVLDVFYDYKLPF